MKNSKRILSMALCVGIALSASLTGCSKTEKETPTSTPAGSGKATELVWYQFVDKIMPDQEKVIAEANKYLKEKLNVTVNANFLTQDDYSQKMPVIISSGQKFDVCFSTSWMVNYNENVAKGAFYPMNDIIDANAKETKEFIPQSFWDAVTIEGKIYGVPGYKESGHQYGIIYNKDLADEMKLDLSGVKKWQDLEPVFKEVKKQKPGVLPIGNNLYNMAMAHEHVSGDWSLPGVLNVPGMSTYARTDDKIFNQFETPEYAAYAKKIHEWYQAGYVPKDPVNYGAVAQQEMKDKKLFSQTIWYAPGCEPSLEKTYGCKIGYIPMYEPILESADATGGALHCISQSSKNPEKAMQFINALTTDEKLGTLLRHGIEGTNYNAKGEQLEKIGDAANPAYDYGSGWVFGTIFNQKWTTEFAADIEQQYLDYNNTTIPATGLGFVFDQSKVKTEVAAINNVIKEFLEPINGGVVDPAKYIPQFNEKLKANGLDTYMKEIQTQFDAWKAAKGK